MKKIFIGIGILCFVVLYIIQVPIYPPPQHAINQPVINFLNGQTITCPDYSLTISQLAHSVDDPIILGGISPCSSVVGGPAYEMYKGLFYIGWIIGAICIFYGISK